MLDQLTKESFEKAADAPFQVHLSSGESIEMQVIEVVSIVSSTGDATWGVPQEGVRSQSFSVVFGGPQEPALSQGMYKMEHLEIGVIEGLFLVPIAEDRDGRYYEAIFN